MEIQAISRQVKMNLGAMCSVFCSVVLAIGLVQNNAHAASIPKPATTFIASPNYNSRGSTTVDSIVIHTTEETYQDTINIFLDPARQVSAHFVIASNGAITQMVDTSNRAWHATYYNSRSVGIEMVGYAGQSSTWNRANLASLTNLLAWLATEFPNVPVVHPAGNAYDFPNDSFNVPGIVAHAQVQPWNRSDPGPYFPWTKTISDVQARLAAVPEPGAPILAAGAMAFLLSVHRHRKQARS